MSRRDFRNIKGGFLRILIRERKMEQSEEKKECKTSKKSLIVGMVCLVGLSLVALCFAILLLFTFEEGFVATYRPLFLAGVSVVASALIVCGVIFGVKGKNSLFRACISVAFLCSFFTTVYFILRKSGFLAIINDPEEYRQFLEHAGGWMAIVYIVLQYLQVILLPIPGFVSTVAGVALFGPHLATLYSFVGIIAGSFTAFFIGRKLGYKAVTWMVGKDDVDKWQNKLKGKDNIILTAMFLLPVFPDDVLCFVAGLSSMTNSYFAWMIVICRVLGIATTCYSIQLLPLNTWWGILSWVCIYAVVLVGFLVFYKNLDKINSWIQKHKKNK